MKEAKLVAQSLRHCAVGIGHCFECCEYGEVSCVSMLKEDAAEVIEELVAKLEERPATYPLALGDAAYTVWYDEDEDRWDIDEIKVTGLGYPGFWYSGSLNDPQRMEVLVDWERVGKDVFRTREAAERKLQELKEEEL